MKFCKYYKNLSKTYSGNYLAVIGFVIFSFSLLGIISRLIHGIVFRNFSIIKAIPICFLGETFCYLPITCILAIIPLIVLFKNLIKPQNSINNQIAHVLISVSLCIMINIFAPDYTNQGSSIIFVFVPLWGFQIPIIIFLIYILLFWFDLAKNPTINNNELINNKFYQKFIQIFYLYATFLAISIPFLAFLLFIIIYHA